MEISKLCQVSVFDWIIPNNKQQTLYRHIYFCSRFLPSYRSRTGPLPPPVLPGSRSPVSLHLYSHWTYLTVPIQISHPNQARFKFPTRRARTTVKHPWVCRWSFELIGALETLYSGQFTLSTQLIKPNYLVIPLPTTYRSFSRNLPPLLIFL